jgi:hypothetical protein
MGGAEKHRRLIKEAYFVMAKKLLFTLLSVLLLAVPVLAQELTQEVKLGDDYIIAIPARWEVEDDEEVGGVALYNRELTLYILTPDHINEVLVERKRTQGRLFMDIYETYFGVRAPEFESVEIGGRTVLQAQFPDEDWDVLLRVVELSDGQFGVMMLLANPRDIDDNRDLIDAILTTFDTANAPAQTAAVSTSSGEACIVSINTRDTARMHVGPGFNRAAIAFMPANVDITVTGVFVADDNSQWFQLDKSQASPDSAAAEVWVNRDDVVESGDCDNVGDAAAPPVIPMANQPPAQPSGDSAQGSVPPSDAIIPQGGTWHFSTSSTTNASCQGGQNVVFNTVEVLDDPEFDVFFTVAANGASVSDGENTFPRTSGTNSYFGSTTIDNDLNGQIWLNFSSPTSLTGQFVFNFRVQGTPCSATFTFSAARR